MCRLYLETNLSKNNAKGERPSQTLSFKILNLFIQAGRELTDKSGFINKKCKDVYPFIEV